MTIEEISEARAALVKKQALLNKQMERLTADLQTVNDAIAKCDDALTGFESIRNALAITTRGTTVNDPPPIKEKKKATAKDRSEAKNIIFNRIDQMRKGEKIPIHNFIKMTEKHVGEQCCRNYLAEYDNAGLIIMTKGFPVTIEKL